MSILQFSIMCESLHFFSTEKQKLGCLVRSHFFGSRTALHVKSGCYFCHKPEQTRALNREAECSVCLVSGNHLYLLYTAPKSPDFLCDRRGDSSDFSMLVPLCFFFLLPQLLMVPHHHPHHLTTNQQNTFRTYTTSTIKNTGAHFSPLFLAS